MPRANGEVRRAQILAASGRLVRRRGFTATRMFRNANLASLLSYSSFAGVLFIMNASGPRQARAASVA